MRILLAVCRVECISLSYTKFMSARSLPTRRSSDLPTADAFVLRRSSQPLAARLQREHQPAPAPLVHQRHRPVSLDPAPTPTHPRHPQRPTTTHPGTTDPSPTPPRTTHPGSMTIALTT